MKKIRLDSAPTRSGSRYPAPYDQACMGQWTWRLGAAAGLSQFGVNLTRLPAGEWSSQRHWHTHKDEFIYVLEGEVVLVTGAGEETLKAGDCAGFKAGVADGHHLQNRGTREALLLEMGTHAPGRDAVTYPDIDLMVQAGDGGYAHKDGRPYPKG